MMDTKNCPTCGKPFDVTRLRGFELCKGADIYTKLPTRATDGSAGYDFYMPFGALVQPYCEISIPLGIKAYMQKDEYLAIHIRSSIGFKKGLRMKNSVGIIDSDYYSNPDNDGNIGVVLCNRTSKPVVLEKGERICQGIFQKYLPVDNDQPIGKRTGGMGSTGK